MEDTLLPATIEVDPVRHHWSNGGDVELREEDVKKWTRSRSR
jgi:hypothetical protein